MSRGDGYAAHVTHRAAAVRGRSRTGPFARAGLTLAMVLNVSLGAQASESALHLGAVRFSQAQQHTQAALTQLMVAQHFGRVGPDAEWLRASLLLDWGLHEAAAQAFDTLSQPAAGSAPRSQADHDEAAYFLALARHRQGRLALAQEALLRIRAPLRGELQIERQLLQAQLWLAQASGDTAEPATTKANRIQQAAEALAAVADLPRDGLGATVASAASGAPVGMATRLARYNLAVTLLQLDPRREPDARRRALALLDTLGQAEATDEAQHSLRDRANLSRGYAALQDEQPRQARVALQRVRLQGMDAQSALLGHGWAAMALNDPALALVAFNELLASTPAESAGLEARLAAPHAQTQLGAYATALQSYQAARAYFAQEQQALVRAQAAVQQPGFLAALDGADPALPELDAPLVDLTGIPQLQQALSSNLAEASGPGNAPPAFAALLPPLASHPFHEGLKRLRELRFISAQTPHAIDRLDGLEHALQRRREAFVTRLPQALALGGAAALAQAGQQRDSLAASLRQAQADADGRAYARSDELTTLDRLAAIRQRLPAQAPEASLAEGAATDTAQRLRRLEGAMVWQLAQRRPAREADAQQALREADIALARGQASEQALSRALQTEPARHAAWLQRIQALRARWQALPEQAQALAAEQQLQLQALALAALQQQHDRLVIYAAQAELGIAQVQDRAQFARQAQQTTATPTLPSRPAKPAAGSDLAPGAAR